MKKKKKTWIVVVIILVILALIAGSVVSCTRALSESLETLSNGFAELSTVEKRDISDTISVSGTVESENIVKITSTLAAKVKTLYVEVGSEVKEGDVLLEFDSTQLQQQYDAMQKTLDNAQGMSDHNHAINVRNLENAQAEKTTTLQQAQRSIDEATSAKTNANQKVNDLRAQLDTLRKTRDNIQAQMNTPAPERPQLPETATPEEIQAAEAAYAEAAATYQENQTALLSQYQAAAAEVQGAEAQLSALEEQLPTFDGAIQSAKDAYTAAERSADTMIQSYQDVLDAEQFSADSSTQDELDALADQIADCVVRAPKSGIVTSLNVAEGSLPTADALMTIEDKDTLKITVQIAESDILKVEEGMPAVVRTTATGDKEFSAQVARVVNIYHADSSAALYGQSGSGGYSAEITIDDPDSELLIGMNAKVQIILFERKDVLSVPYESIVEEDGKSYVLLAETNPESGLTTAKKAQVEPGEKGTYYVEITSEEVKEGDQVVVDGASYQDGDMLFVMPDLNASPDADEDGDSDA